MFRTRGGQHVKSMMHILSTRRTPERLRSSVRVREPRFHRLTGQVRRSVTMILALLCAGIMVVRFSSSASATTGNHDNCTTTVPQDSATQEAADLVKTAGQAKAANKAK
jgi:hypothetical protein